MMDLQQLKLWFNPRTPWEVDFRDLTIVSKAAFHSIKLGLTMVSVVLTCVLSTWCGFNYFRYQTKTSDLKTIENYINTNKKISENYRQTNKEFMEEKDKVFKVFDNFNTGFSTLDFLNNLIQSKTKEIKFSTVIIQDNKEYGAISKNDKANLLVQLYGSLNDDVTYIDTYKETVLAFSSLKSVKNCKSFIQFDQNQNRFSAKDIKFQLTVQTNE